MTDAEKRLLKIKDEFFLKLHGGINAKEVKGNENIRKKRTNITK